MDEILELCWWLFLASFLPLLFLLWLASPGGAEREERQGVSCRLRFGREPSRAYSSWQTDL